VCVQRSGQKMRSSQQSRSLNKTLFCLYRRGVHFGIYMKKVPFPQYSPAQDALFLIALSTLASALFMQSAQAEIAKHTEPYISYAVQKGDTLQALSRNLLAEPKRWNELAKLNGLKNPNLILPDQVIDVPQSMINFANQPKLATTGVLTSANGSVTINGVPAQTGAVVPEGANLQTGVGSSAVVKMSDGSSVQMMPRTLGQVLQQHGYTMRDPSSSISTTWFSGTFRLIEGLLDVAAAQTIKRKEPFKVMTPTSSIGVRGTHFRVAHDAQQNQATRVEVEEGKVRADVMVQGVGTEVDGGFGVLMMPNDREIKRAALLPALPQSALPARIERSREGGQAVWNVASLSGASAYRAELAQDAAFARIVFDTKSSSNGIDLGAAPNGTYFARVRGIDSLGIEGFNAARQVDVVAAPAAPMSLIWVKEINIAATADLLPEGLVLRVNTSSVDTPRDLRVQIAQDAAMTQGLETLAISSTGTVVLKGLQAGQRRFLRFTGNSPQGVASSSAVYELNLPIDWGTTVLSISGALQPIR
jgi:hypothetical protein